MRNTGLWLSLLLVVTLALGGCKPSAEPLQAPANVEEDEGYTSEYTPEVESEEYIATIEDDTAYDVQATGQPVSPGSPMFSFKKNWMGLTAEIHDKKLKNICFPATHDSGTWSLQSRIAPEKEARDFEDMFKQGDQIFKDIKEFLGPVVSGVIGLDGIKDSIKKEIYRIVYAGTRGLAMCTNKTIDQQLNDGIRAFDLRVYLSSKGAYTHHTLVGPSVEAMLSSIRSFLQSTNGEIVIVQMSAWIAEKDKTKRYQAFATKVQKEIGEYAYQKKMSNGVITNPVFEQTYNDIFSQKKGPGSRVILVFNGAPVSVSNDPMIWDSDQLGMSGSYPNTTSKDNMISDQKSKFTSAQSSGKPFRLYMTLTPQSDDCKTIVATKISNELPDKIAPLITWIPGVKEELAKLIRNTIGIKEWKNDWRTVKGLSNKVNGDLGKTLKENFQGPGLNNDKSNIITILYTDFYENTTVVDMAIEYSRYPIK